MNENQFCNELKATIPDLQKEWKDKYALFLTDENLNDFSKNLFYWYQNPNSEVSGLPYFKEEILISKEVFLPYFTAIFEALESNSDQLKFEIINMFEKTPFEIILLILGQRLTSASVRDESAIPPSKEILLESCLQPFNTETSIVVRAWEKHVGRKKDSIFGEIKGNNQQKQETVEKLVHYIIANKTWWNVFFHYKHDVVYEIRIPNGQGMRWSRDGKKFIGFLEHFLEE
ncbi:hypothetical protein [uncultured Flavobacterium sp.]|uniref:hypothetical protein n=1 Tax=uncultured Flavobacterium sp. TaxID=165435 RepID=UPI003081CCEE